MSIGLAAFMQRKFGLIVQLIRLNAHVIQRGVNDVAAQRPGN